MSENKVVNKYCLVPDCPNTSKNAPEKWFINVPSDIKIRNVWQKATRREVFVSNKSHVYCCEDHFKITMSKRKYNTWTEEDMNEATDKYQKIPKPTFTM
ncbi:hypothetical protein JTB14_007100 [Gonioctena quinquepunctata]|nr:hypothetical protein JTB14_007100 [Gonioctena quinquepunctata]